MAVNVADLIVKIGGDVTSFTNAMGRVEARLQKTGASLKRIGSDLTIGLSAPLGILAGAIGKTAIDFESSFAGVRKTVDATEEEFAHLADGFREMSKIKPIDVNEINRIGEAAGQLGIKKENIIDFTSVMADLGNTTDLSSDQAATAFARIANVMQIPQDQFSNMGSAIVDLGNNLASTESEISNFAIRIAGAGKAVGLSVDEVFAFSGAMTSAGIKAEAGGTAISRVMIDIAKRVSAGGEALQEIADVTGMTGDQFKKTFQEDASEAILQFIESIGSLDKSEVFPLLEKLGLDSVRLTTAIVNTAGAGDLLRRSLDGSKKAYADNIALTEEARKRYETVASQLTIFWNRIKDVAITIGTSMLPAVSDLLKSMKPMINIIENLSKQFSVWFDTLSDGTRQGVLVAVAGLILLGPALLGVGAAMHIIAPVFATLALLTSGIGLGFILTAGTIVAGVAVIVANWEFLKSETIRIWERISRSIQMVVEHYQKQINFLKKILGGFLTFFGMVGETMRKAVAPIGEAILDTGEDVKEGLGVMRDLFTSTFKGFIGDLVNEIPKIPFAFEKAGEDSKKALEKIPETVTRISDEVRIAAEKMEANITSNLVSQKDARLTAINIELQDRIRAIKEFGLSATEQERLITLAQQSAIVERKQAQGGFTEFMKQQLMDIQSSNVFTLSTITSSFANATASWIQGVNSFADFWKQTLNTMLVASINFVIQWLAKQALMKIQGDAINAGILIAHTATEKAKTVATAVGETSRSVMAAATNKVIIGGMIATITAIGAVGTAAMLGMTAVVITTTGVLAAIGAALIATVVGAPLGSAFMAASGAVFAAGTTATAAGTAAITASTAAAMATAGAAMATPLAEGGIITSPTVALMGEAGPEAVIPLSGLPSFLTPKPDPVEPSLSIAVNISGNVIGEESFIHEKIIPAIEESVRQERSNLALRAN